MYPNDLPVTKHSMEVAESKLGNKTLRIKGVKSYSVKLCLS